MILVYERTGSCTFEKERWQQKSVNLFCNGFENIWETGLRMLQTLSDFLPQNCIHLASNCKLYSSYSSWHSGIHETAMPLAENEPCSEGIVALELPLYAPSTSFGRFMNTLPKLISVQDCQWYTFTVFGIGVPACSQTCSKYTSRACSYRAYTGVAVVAQVQVRVNLCKHRENTRFYKHCITC